MTKLDEYTDLLFEGLSTARSGIDNSKLLWNEMNQATGDSKRRLIGEFINQLEKCEKGIRQAESMAEAVL